MGGIRSYLRKAAGGGATGSRSRRKTNCATRTRRGGSFDRGPGRAAHDPDPYRLCNGPAPSHGWIRVDASGTAASWRRERTTARTRWVLHGRGPSSARRARQTLHRLRPPLLVGHGSDVPEPPVLPLGGVRRTQDRSRAPPTGHLDATTIWDKLAAAGVSGGYYYADTPASFLVYGARMQPFVRSLDRYFEDCANGTLPNFVFIAPSFVGPYRTDNHRGVASTSANASCSRSSACSCRARSGTGDRSRSSTTSGVVSSITCGHPSSRTHDRASTT